MRELQEAIVAILGKLKELIGRLRAVERDVEAIKAVEIPAPRDGRDPTPEEIEAAAAKWLLANITQPKDGSPGEHGKPGRPGPAPTALEIELAVELWMEFNLDRIRGKDGKDVTPAQVAKAAAAWLSANIRQPKDGDPGKSIKGDDGIGVQAIEQPARDVMRVQLTDGRYYDVRLPLPSEPKAQSNTTVIQRGGGGLTQEQAQAMITEALSDMPFDDYSEVEYLSDQASIGGVLTFTFLSGPVQKVWVEIHATGPDDEATGRVRVDGIDPTATVGTLLHVGQAQPISSPPTTTVKVLAPSGRTVSVYGYRR